MNINYDYLFIIPLDNDSDFYYVRDIRLIYRASSVNYYTCDPEYTVYYYKQKETFKLMKPLKKRINTNWLKIHDSPNIPYWQDV